MAKQADQGPDRTGWPAYEPPRAPVSLNDFLARMWRAKWLMLITSLPIIALGLFTASQMPKLYEAEARLFVQATPGPVDPAIMATELAIADSLAVAQNTVSRFPANRIAPHLGPSGDRPARGDAHLFNDALAMFKHSFSARAEAGAVLTLSYRHSDASTAGEILNAALASYLNYRDEIMDEAPVAPLAANIKQMELDLLTAEDAARAFLNDHQIGSFSGERTAAQAVFVTLRSELVTVNALLLAQQTQVSEIRAQLADTPQTQPVPGLVSLQQSLRNLKAERSQLLARYLPDSRAVQAIDQQIAALEAELADPQQADSQPTQPNPQYQALASALNTHLAQLRGLQRQRAELEADLAETEAMIQRFTELEPQWQALQRQRQALEAGLVELTRQAELQRFEVDEAEMAKVTLKPLSETRVSEHPKSQTATIYGLTVLFAFVSAMLVGLLHAFTQSGFTSGRTLQRAMKLPVLAAIRKQH